MFWGMRIPIATIAGSDPSGGAGLQADLRVFTLLGAYGQAVPTALTIQNSLGVKKFVPLEASLVKEQLEAIFEDLSPKAVKTGMLPSAEVVHVVAEVLETHRPLLVIDPVVVSSSGALLMEEGTLTALKERLFPLASVITPNLPEAAALLEKKDVSLAEDVARALLSLGPQAVVLKGGHASGDKAVDLVCAQGEIRFLKTSRIMGEVGHGTGCTFSAALTVFLAQGLPVHEAAQRAKDFVYLALLAAKEHPLGRGLRPLDHLIHWERLHEQKHVLLALEQAAQFFCRHPVRPLIPEVQSNLAYALPYAQNHQEVAAFPGRIVALGEGAKVVGCPQFGTSRHVANIVLAAMRYDPQKRAALNIRFREAYLKQAQDLGLKWAEFSRAEEPKDIKEREGSTLAWGVDLVCQRLGYVPDLIADRGEVGKEPMIRILGKDPLEVVKKALLFLEED